MKDIVNEKLLKIFFAVYIAYYFADTVMRYQFRTAAFFALAAFVIVFFIKLEYAFYLILLTRSLVDAYSDMGAGGISLPIMIGGLIALLFVSYFAVCQYNVFNLSVNRIYGAFLLLCIPAVFFTHKGLVYGAGFWFRLFTGFVVLNLTVLVVLSAGEESYKKRINIICWSVILSLVLPYGSFIRNVLTGAYYLGAGYVRYSTFAGVMNVFSYYLLATLPFFLFFYSVTEKKSRKTAWLVFFAVYFYTVYINYTRNVWIGVFFLILTWTVLKRYFVITYSIVAFVALMFVLDPTVQDRLKDIFIILTSNKGFFELDPHLLSQRILIWQKNLRYFINSSTIIEKLLGNGFDIRDILGATRTGRRAIEHNNYLVLLMSTGVLGLSFYMLYILKLFRESFRLLRRTGETYFRNLAQVFIAFLVSYVIIGMGTHAIWKLTFQYFLSVFAGLVVAANIIEENRRMKKEPAPAVATDTPGGKWI